MTDSMWWAAWIAEEKLKSLPSDTASGPLGSNLVPGGEDAGELLGLQLPCDRKWYSLIPQGQHDWCLPVLAKICPPPPLLWFYLAEFIILVTSCGFGTFQHYGGLQETQRTWRNRIPRVWITSKGTWAHFYLFSSDSKRAPRTLTPSVLLTLNPSHFYPTSQQLS